MLLLCQVLQENISCSAELTLASCCRPSAAVSAAPAAQAPAAQAPAAQIPAARPSAADTPSASSLSNSDFPALGGASSSKAPAWGSKQKANSLPRVDKVSASHRRTRVCLLATCHACPQGFLSLKIAHQVLQSVSYFPQGLAARGNSASINSLDAANMPMHVFSISSMSVCHAWQDGFEIVYGKGKGPRPQTVAADVPAPKTAPAAEAQPAQQPPPQVKCQPCKGLSVSPM